MKKEILFAATLIAALSSCSNDETISTNVESRAIGFKVITDKATKATPMVTNKLLDFNVWGYYHASASTDYTSTLYIDVDPSRTADPNEFEYTPLKYWPEDSNSEIDFFAVTPKAYATRGTGTAAGSMPMTCTIAATAADQKDLLFAQELDKNYANAGATHTDALPGHNGTNSVLLHFRHALSQIKFEAKSSEPNVYFKITGITIKSVNSYGETDLANATNGWPKTTSVAAGGNGNGLVWTAQSTPLDFAYSVDATAKSVYNASTYVDVEGTDGSLMLLPQSTTGMSVEIAYTMYDAATDIELKTSTKTIEAGTADATKFANQVAEWWPGVTYTYRLTLTPDLKPILFSAEVEDWADFADTDITI